MEFIHKPVLLRECLEGLNIRPEGPIWMERWVARAIPGRSPGG
ncbi:MAG: hypothetical protein ACLSAF_19570 [Intestinimonas sp.]